MSSESIPKEVEEDIQSYYTIPDEYETTTSANGRDLSEGQIAELEKEIQELFEQQITGMSGKKMQFYEKTRAQEYRYRKHFICSAWMRGFCFFRGVDCLHAHGVDDLVYTRGDFSYDAQTHYERIDIKQFAHNLNYIHLYEFSRRYDVMSSHQNISIFSEDTSAQNTTEENSNLKSNEQTQSTLPSKTSDISMTPGAYFSLEQINNERTIRTVIREFSRTKIFEDFFLLLRRTYDDIFITEAFLVKEFIRIGVGSDALGFGIKSGRICNYLTRNLCYVAKAYLPCSVQHYQSLLVVKNKAKPLHEYFKEKIVDSLYIIKSKGDEFSEANIKTYVKERQGSEIAPSFEVYLVKENMCLFKYFKFYAATDLKFFEKVLSFVQKKDKKAIIKEGEEAEVVEGDAVVVVPAVPVDGGEVVNEQETEDDSVAEVEKFKFVIQFYCCSDASEKTQRKQVLLEAYLAKRFPTEKKKLCRYWLRGLCMFDKSVCHFSHGITDLIYEKYDENVEDAEYKQFASQKPLWKERTYVGIFNEQPELVRKGIIDKMYSQQELDDQKELREGIREKMQINAMEEFLERMWDTYGRNVKFTRSLVNREFERVGFFQIGYSLKNQMIIDIISQRKSFLLTSVLPPLIKPIQVIMPFPEYSEVLSAYAEIILKIYSDTAVEFYNELKLKEEQQQQNSKGNSSPGLEQIVTTATIADESEEDRVNNNNNEMTSYESTASVEKEDSVGLFSVNEYVIRKMIYKENQYALPPLHLIMKYFSRNLEQIIFDVLDSKPFQEKFKIALPEFKLSGLKNSILLDSDIERVTSVIDEAISNKQSKVFINYQNLFNRIYKVFRSQIKASNGFIRFRENVHKILFEKHACEFFNMGSKLLLFQRKVFQASLKGSAQPASSKAVKQSATPLSTVLHYVEEYIAEKRTFPVVSSPLIDRIIVVDKEESIESATAAIKLHGFIGVDLEGNLSKNGKIELVQISCYDFHADHAIVYVFDTLVLSQNQELFTKCLTALRSIFEDPNIVKIMQGCNKDALALFHLFESRIVNGIDTQIVHNVIGQLEEIVNPQKSQKQQQDKKVLETRYYNSGLNVILQVYGAPNGLNPLKSKFQAVFSDMKLVFEYMTKRPINEEFLVYSSKDVEDLIPVYFRMLKIVHAQLKKLFKNATLAHTNTFLQRVSDVTIRYKPREVVVAEIPAVGGGSEVIESNEKQSNNIDDASTCKNGGEQYDSEGK